MTMLLFIFELLLALTTVVSLGFLWYVLYFRRGRDAVLERRYVMLLCDTLLKPPDAGSLPLPFVSMSNSAGILGRLLCDFKRLVAEYSFRKVRGIMSDAGVESYYLSRYKHSVGYKMTENMRILSSVPLSAQGMDEILSGKSDNRHADLYGVFTEINTAPTKMSDMIRRRDRLFTGFCAAQIVDRLVRDRIEIDWKECLDSGNDNLRLLGLSLSGMYHIEEASSAVYGVLRQELGKVSAVGFAALTCAVMLNLSPTSIEISSYVKRLNADDRRSVYRMFIRNGYSRMALRLFVDYESEHRSGLDEYIKLNMNARRRVLTY